MLTLSIFSFSHDQLMCLHPHLLTHLLRPSSLGHVSYDNGIHRGVDMLQPCAAAALFLHLLTVFEPAALSQVPWTTDGGQDDLPSASVRPDTHCIILLPESITAIHVTVNFCQINSHSHQAWQHSMVLQSSPQD